MRIPSILKSTALLLALVSAPFSPAMAVETTARAAMVLDFNTGTVLFAKNETIPMPPASMSKLMTLNMVFEALEDGRLRLDEKLAVSEKAMSYKGSSMYLTTRDRVSVEDLIRGVIILSGNDATVVLAEAIAGSEKDFARAMNARAKALGMMESTFSNSNGWPDPIQRMSARDLVFLADRLIRVFPQYYGYFSEKEFLFDGRVPTNSKNRNPLLKLNIGADGLKTGHTDEAGFGLVGSAKRDGRRVVVMITGTDSAKERSSEAEKLINWAFRQFVEKKVLNSGEEVGRINVWLGQADSVGVSVGADLDMLLPIFAAENVDAVIEANSPIEAPITKGQELGKLIVTVPDMPSRELILLANEDVAASGFVPRFKLSAAQLLEKTMGLLK